MEYKITFRAVKSGQFKDSIDCIFLDCFENNYSLTCYAHIGQHSMASIDYVYHNTRPAQPNEYKTLLRELQGIYEGETLTVTNKLPAMSKLISKYNKR